MLIKFFDNTQPVTRLSIFILLLIIIGFSLYSYVYNPVFHADYLIQKNYPRISDSFGLVISVISVLSVVLTVGYIAHAKDMMKDNSYASLFAVLLIASQPSIVILNPVLIATIFLMLSFKEILSMHKQVNVSRKLFNSGLLIGIASVIHPYAIFYVLLIFIGIIIYGVDNWRQWTYPILGIVTPIYFLFTWFLWNDSLDYFYQEFFIKKFEFTLDNFNYSTDTTVLWAIYFFLTLFSIIDYTRNMKVHKLDTRKGYSITYLALIIGIIIVLFGTIKNGQELIILYFPISIIWGKYIQHRKKQRWRNIFFLFVLLSLILSYVI